MSSAFGKRDDINSGGRCHLTLSHKDKGILSQSSPSSNSDSAFSRCCPCIKMDNKQNIATATVGEGSSNQGDFHEVLTLQVCDLPFVCVIINNNMLYQYQIHCAAAEKLSDRALGYGMYGEQVDGNDPICL